MSLKIKIPKPVDAELNSAIEPPRTSGRIRRPSKRRQEAMYTDDDGEGDFYSAAEGARPKRARRDTRSAEASNEDADVDVDGEEEVVIEDEEDVPGDDTRFLPPALRQMKAAQSRSTPPAAKAKSKPPPKKSSNSKKKRAVVYSDDDAEDDYNTAERDDEDSLPEASSSKKKARGKSSIPSSKPIKLERDDRDARDTTMKEESRPSVSLKRSLSAEDDELVPIKDELPLRESPPPVKRPKLPPIKKNKLPSKPNPTSTSNLPPKPPPKPPAAASKDELVLPVSSSRKPAATANNADFDLRDASVYAQLFNKPGGSTPNAGLNRKEREEQRRKELNKMREDARAKRQEQAKHTFDLQASHEKIQRFADKLVQRRSGAMFPNMLGGAFKDAFERAKQSRNGRSPH